MFGKAFGGRLLGEGEKVSLVNGMRVGILFWAIFKVG